MYTLREVRKFGLTGELSKEAHKGSSGDGSPVAPLGRVIGACGEASPVNGKWIWGWRLDAEEDNFGDNLPGTHVH